MAKKISELANGSLVKDTGTTYYGKPIIWQIADKNHSGYPANSTTLVTCKIIKLAGFDGKEVDNADGSRQNFGNSRYRTSNLRQWLNSNGAANTWWTAQNLTDGTVNTNNHDTPPTTANMHNYNGYDTEAGFLTNFSAKFKAALLTTTLTVAKNNYTDGGGSETVNDKIFLASLTEVGFGTENNIVEGSKLAIFNTINDCAAYPTAEAITNNTCTDSTLRTDRPWIWWLRTPYIGGNHAHSVRNIRFNEKADYSTAYEGTNGVRPLCNLSSDTYVSDTPDSDGVYTIIWNRPPTTPVSITVPNTVLAGTGLEIAWGTATDPEGSLAGYKLERSANGGGWTQIFSGAALKYTDTAARTGVTALQYRVKAYDILGMESGYKVSSSVTVNPNNPPTFSGSDSDLGVKNGAFSLNYTITSATAGATITVVEKIGNTVKRSYNPASGVEQTFSVSTYDFLTLGNGTHTMSIAASDQYGANSVRTYTFTKNEAQLEFLRSEPMSADAQPERIKATLNYVAPTGAEVKVYACNNGFDSNPTWEDITAEVLDRAKYLFTNKTKTAGKWGVNIKVCIKRNGAVGDCYVSGIGGNFD